MPKSPEKAPRFHQLFSRTAAFLTKKFKKKLCFDFKCKFQKETFISFLNMTEIDSSKFVLGTVSASSILASLLYNI